jgi:hypothetical protein
LNTKSKVLKQGLIFGYNQTKPILKIDTDFHFIEHEEASGDTVLSVEAWGCGNQAAELEQEKMKKWEKNQIEKMKKVKLNAEWNDNADRAILDLAGIKTEHSERGDL